MIIEQIEDKPGFWAESWNYERDSITDKQIK
ncbi:hypothetical protein C7475_101955 [Chitinophaga sp. S165]|nr:hypothetical protein C7475_101955 [Chitinophaga sp. S165]